MTSHRIIDLTHLGYIAASWEYVRLTEGSIRPDNTRITWHGQIWGEGI